ncbi:MAG: MFS transporter [Dehalococcoidia bacterium]|nr:MFS transporter [Dehalococcoidia bacterium]
MEAASPQAGDAPKGQIMAGGMGAVPDGPPSSQRSSFWRTFESLRERDYAWYFWGNTAFFMAMQMNIVVRGFLAYDLTDSATALGLVSLGFALPMLFVAPLAGVVSDRVNKRNLIMVAQSGTGLVNLAMAILVMTGVIEFWHLLVAAVATGCIMSLVMPARQAIIPALVPQHLLMNAISLQMGGMNLTRIIGPTLGGILIAPLGVGGVYLVTVALFFIGVVSILPLPRHGMVSRKEGDAATGFVQDLWGGFTYVAADPLFRLLILAALLMPLFMFPVQQLLPVFAEDTFADMFVAEGRGLGLLMGATGVGGLIGAFVATNMSEVRKKGPLMGFGALFMSGCFVVFGTTSLWLPLTAAFWGAAVMLILGNVGAMIFQVTNNTIIQANVPDEYRGRVMSFLMMSFGTMPLGVVPVAYAADRWGAPAATIGAQLIAVAAVVLMFGLSKRLRQLEFGSLERAEMSPAQAAILVAEGKISQEEADRLTGRARPGATPAPVTATAGRGDGQAAG